MKICGRQHRRLRLLRAVGLGAVLFALSTIGEKASAFTLLQYDFSQSGYISGSSEGTLTGNFTGEVDPDGLVTSVSTLTFQFQLVSGGTTSLINGSLAPFFFSFDPTSNTLALAAVPNRGRDALVCINTDLDGCNAPSGGSFILNTRLRILRTVNQPVLTFDQGIFGVTDPPPPIEPPPILAVPEASTWSLMALGFAAFGFAHWRRKPKLKRCVFSSAQKNRPHSFGPKSL